MRITNAARFPCRPAIGPARVDALGLVRLEFNQIDRVKQTVAKTRSNGTYVIHGVIAMWWCGCVLRAGLAMSAAGDATSTPVCATLDELRARITEHISQSRFDGAIWGVHILSLDSGKIWFEHNSSTRLRPASNAKLFTAALALDRLGPEHRIRTSILARQQPDETGTISGDLIIRGRGDFSMAARFHQGDHGEVLDPLVRAIERAGVRHVGGGLIADATWFHGPPFGAGWTWEDLRHPYGAAVSALNIEDNVVVLRLEPGGQPGEPCRVSMFPASDWIEIVNHTITVESNAPAWFDLQRPLGGNQIHLSGQVPLHSGHHLETIPVHDPAFWFVNRLRAALESRDVHCVDAPRAMNWLSPPAWFAFRDELIELAAVESPPLRELLGPMLKESQNLYAHALWLHVGASTASEAPAAPAPPSGFGVTPRKPATQAASVALREFLEMAGIPSTEVFLDEGSGLSRRALITPRAIVQLLERMSRHQDGALYRAALPVAGVDGSLATRMHGTAAAGNLTAKTGMLAHTFSLSGYVRTGSGERLAFAILLNNHFAASSEAARADLDTIAILLAGFQGSPAPVH
jgi:serine-type D-Ala-D-Ala carboxypeptidase/endopeptidase (penicillin-binding protein 4)